MINQRIHIWHGLIENVKVTRSHGFFTVKMRTSSMLSEISSPPFDKRAGGIAFTTLCLSSSMRETVLTASVALTACDMPATNG